MLLVMKLRIYQRVPSSCLFCLEYFMTLLKFQQLYLSIAFPIPFPLSGVIFKHPDKEYEGFLFLCCRTPLGLEETKDHRVREYFSRLKRKETKRIKSIPTSYRIYFDRLHWNMLIFSPCPTPYISVLDKGKLQLHNCFLPSISTFH